MRTLSEEDFAAVQWLLNVTVNTELPDRIEGRRIFHADSYALAAKLDRVKRDQVVDPEMTTDQLREVCEALGCRQKDMANELGVSVKTMQRWDSDNGGIVPPPYAVYIRAYVVGKYRHDN